MITNDPPLTRSAAGDLIDQRCDAFERLLRTGAEPAIADFILPADEPYQGKLFLELLLVDLEYRRQRGEHPIKSDYILRYPAFAAQIEAANFVSTKSTFETLRRAETAPIDQFQSGERIEQFELKTRLGAGAMGEVWKAWDSRLNRFVAIKFPRAPASDPKELQRFYREAQTAAQLRHPQLSGIHEIGRHHNRLFIVTDFIDGCDLRAYLNNHQLSPLEAATLCAELADTLQTAHARGIVHRDLKPANIIIDLKGKPHIIDFGLAKLATADADLTILGEVLGTPAYMSPEQASGHASLASASSDVYSLGIILYEMLTGRCPFVGDRSSIVHQVLTDHPLPIKRLRPSVPRDLVTICQKAIHKEPRSRYEDAGQMALDLHRFTRGEPILARPDRLPAKTWRYIRRNPVRAALLTLTIAGTILALTVIENLRARNHALGGYRPVLITTSPPGALVALVPVDATTGEPDAGGSIIRPRGTTPLTTELRPGRYFVEVALPNPDRRPPATAHSAGNLPFAEAFRTVPPLGRSSPFVQSLNRERRLPAETFHMGNIKIPPSDSRVDNMVAVPIRGPGHAPGEILYVERDQTTVASTEGLHKDRATWVTENGNGVRGFTLESAIRCAEASGCRLPSADEYDAIAESLSKASTSAADGAPLKINGLADDVFEWTTTKGPRTAVLNSPDERSQQFQVLKGYDGSTQPSDVVQWINGDHLASPYLRSPQIGLRGVRYARPRFIRQ